MLPRRPIENLYRTVADLPAGAPLPTRVDRSDPPFLELAEVRTDDAIVATDAPFIYRDFPWLPSDEAFFAAHLEADPTVWGYRSAPKDNAEDWDDAALTGRDVWSRFRAGTLGMSIVDSQCSDQGPVLAGWCSERLPRPPSVGWMLTRAPAVTFFHQDPPYGDCFQYIAHGEKIWMLFPPHELATIRTRHGFAIVNTLPLADLVVLDDALLWGKIRIGRLGDGDLLFFPEGWPHFVRTLRPSIGFAGYFGHDGDSGKAWEFAPDSGRSG